jgi:hypothetical protein
VWKVSVRLARENLLTGCSHERKKALLILLPALDLLLTVSPIVLSLPFMSLALCVLARRRHRLDVTADATRAGDEEEEDTGERPGSELPLDVVDCGLGAEDDLSRIGAVEGLGGIAKGRIRAAFAVTGAAVAARLALPSSRTLGAVLLSGPDSLSSLVCASASVFSSRTTGTMRSASFMRVETIWLSVESGRAPRIDDVCDNEKSHESTLL